MQGGRLPFAPLGSRGRGLAPSQVGVFELVRWAHVARQKRGAGDPAGGRQWTVIEPAVRQFKHYSLRKLKLAFLLYLTPLSVFEPSRFSSLLATPRGQPAHLWSGYIAHTMASKMLAGEKRKRAVLKGSLPVFQVLRPLPGAKLRQGATRGGWACRWMSSTITSPQRLTRKSCTSTQGNNMATETPKKPVTFSTVWNNYPSSDPCVSPRTNKKAYDNQCAIRVGIALEKSGVSFAGFRGPRCEFGAKGNGMVLRVRELASWLNTKPFKECGPHFPTTGEGFESALKGKKGIVYFEDYWLRDGEKLPTGDHIDLWNIDRLTPSFETWMRFTLGVRELSFRGRRVYSSLQNSRKVSFWSLP